MQADVDVRHLSGLAIVASTSLTSSPVKVTNSVTTCSALLPRPPGVIISENVTTATIASGADSSLTDVGDKFEYHITVSNTGNTGLRNVNTSDLMFDDLACERNYVDTEAPLLPGGSVVCRLSLTLE